MRPLLFRVRRWPRRVLASFWEPATQTELIQIVKMTAAAVGAWLLVGLIDLGQQFLAPWTAMLTVHATVYRSFSRGAQTVAATVFGIGLSYVVVQLIGVGAAAMGIVLLVGLLIARLGFHRDEGVTVATTALFVLTTGDTHDESALLGRFLATAIGVGVGVVVNIVAFPPLNHRSAQQQIDRINQKLGSLLSEMAGQMRSAWAAEESDSWIERTREMDDDLERAWTLVHFARESDWSNPRRRRLASSDQPAQYSAVLERLEEGVAHTRSMARLVRESTRSAQEWDPRFREPWLDLLTETGQRVWDPDAEVASLRERINAMTEDLSGEDLPGLLWPLYGGLISNLLVVIDVVDDVASARPIRT